MRRIKSVGLAVASVFALAASIGATSASAFTVWQVDGRNVTTSTAMTFTATLDLTHRGGLGGNFTIRCTLTGTGTVRSGGTSTVDSITVTSCTTISGTCGSPTLGPAYLTWNGLFSGSRNTIRPGPSGRNPGWRESCSGFSGECTATTSTAITNSFPNVLATYDSSSATLSCTDLATATVTGTVTNSIAGHSLGAA